MPAERYYLNAPFQENQHVSIEGQEFQHLARVMRAHPGDNVELVNGKNQLAQAIVQKVEKKEAELSIQSVETTPPSKNKIILVQAIPRPNRLDFILEKGTELGVSEFWLFPGQQSEKEEFSPNQNERMQTITIAAMKQCGRLDLPPIHLKPPLLKWPPQEGTLLFGDVQKDAPFLGHIPTPRAPILFFVGPEKGFTSTETNLLKKWGAQGVSLHSNTLRVDTAAIAAIIIVGAHECL